MTQKHIVNNFIHREGDHCESSSMRDLFEFYGIPMSEAMVFGLDGSMGFGFFESSTDRIAFGELSDNIPFFSGGKQDTIKPNSLACQLLGINLKKESFSSADKAWEQSKRLILQDKPLILRTDIAYLPYLVDEDQEEIHFGGHTISLAGYDEDKGVAYVGDSTYKGFQEVPIEKLKQARSSEYGDSFMRPQNTQFSMELRLDGKRPPLAAGVKLAIKKVVDHMLRPSISSLGLQGLKRFCQSILNWDNALQGQIKSPCSGKTYNKARMMFELFHGYVETWGTGGASFRNLYKSFLEELLVFPELKEGPRAWKEEDYKTIQDSIPLINDSAKSWTLIAETLKNSADTYKDDCINHVDFGELHNIALFILSKEEELFKNLLKIKI